MADDAAAEDVDVLLDFEESFFFPQSKSNSVGCLSTALPSMSSVLSTATGASATSEGRASGDDRAFVDCILFVPRGLKKLARLFAFCAAASAA